MKKYAIKGRRMLIGAIIFFIIAIFMAIYRFTGTNPTYALIAKILLYFSVIAFFILLYAYFFKSVPPLPEKKTLPL
jgi:uncharacterized membrane protein YtjA (UPF0391 family)